MTKKNIKANYNKTPYGLDSPESLPRPFEHAGTGAIHQGLRKSKLLK